MSNITQSDLDLCAMMLGLYCIDRENDLDGYSIGMPETATHCPGEWQWWCDWELAGKLIEKLAGMGRDTHALVLYEIQGAMIAAEPIPPAIIKLAARVERGRSNASL